MVHCQYIGEKKEINIPFRNCIFWIFQKDSTKETLYCDHNSNHLNGIF
uniref:Uncharacterized protein n=1 Tax=Rhizophora mucronata TaxID=61149 RepID=A0A2P2NR10_RHIMU